MDHGVPTIEHTIRSFAVSTARFDPRARARTLIESRPAAVLSLLGALALSLFLAVHKFEVDIAVYLLGGGHAFSAALYSVHLPDRTYLAFTYPPFAAIVFAPMGQVLSRTTAQVLWAIVNVASLYGLLALSLRLVVPRLGVGVRRRWSLLLVLPALLLNPVFLTVGLGQVDLVLCLAVLFDLCTPRRIGGVTIPLGVATGVAAAIKLTPLIFVPYLLLIGRRRGALTAAGTFAACSAFAFALSPHASAQYWTHEIYDAERAGALFDVSDQNLRSALSRLLHAPLSPGLMWPLAVAVALVGLVIAVSAHRRSSPLLGVLVCANTSLLVSPITWTHHLVWVIPAILWLACAPDAPRYGRFIAAALSVVFWCAPIWWVPTSYVPSQRPVELREHGWQLVAGNSFALALVLALGSAGILIWRRAPDPASDLEVARRPPVSAGSGLGGATG